MGRPRRTLDDAKPTTISLTLPQHIAFEKLQVKRQEEGEVKPTLTDVMLEGFQIVLRKEDWSQTELERIFPKQERPKAIVQVISKRPPPRR
jgi:hypothetical protein